MKDNIASMLATIIMLVFIVIISLLNIPKPKLQTVEKYIYKDTCNYDSKWLNIKVVTCYQATKEQCDADPTITASGAKINPEDAFGHRYIAISRDLLKYFSFGDTIEISGIWRYQGKFVVNDLMNKRWKNRIDILVSPRMYCGKWRNVKIRKV